MHGHSTEAEVRKILEHAARPEDRLKLGSLLASISRDVGGMSEAEAESFNQLRDKTPVKPMKFE